VGLLADALKAGMTTRLPILLVEDDDDVLDAIRDVLEDAGYEVTPARSGAQALEILRSGSRPAAMVVDFMMVGMNGRELLDACAADGNLAGIPALIMSAGRQAELAAEGVHSYVPKPFHPDRFLDALAALVSDRKRMSG
jgi:CheY-like chemotaxis protein